MLYEVYTNTMHSPMQSTIVLHVNNHNETTTVFRRIITVLYITFYIWERNVHTSSFECQKLHKIKRPFIHCKNIVDHFNLRRADQQSDKTHPVYTLVYRMSHHAATLYILAFSNHATTIVVYFLDRLQS